MKRFISLILYFFLFLAIFTGSSSPIYAAANDPSFSIMQSAGVNGGYKLVFSAWASDKIGSITVFNTRISYDNTVVTPVNRINGTGVDLYNSDSVQRRSAFKNHDYFINTGSLNVKENGSLTTFDIAIEVLANSSGVNCASGEVLLEFYFKLKEGKTTADMNASTFALAATPEPDVYYTLLGSKDGTAYKYGGRGGEYSLSLTSFTYTNSNVQSGGQPGETTPPTSGGGTSTVTPPVEQPVSQTDPATEQAQGLTGAYKPMLPLHSPGTRVEAVKTNNPLLLDDEETVFPAVKIGGNNWLKLRDFAMLLHGSSKQFSVFYDKEGNIIDIRTGQVYMPLGDELADKLANVETAISSPQRLRVNGEFIDTAAYNIMGYNYFRLRDLAIILNFDVIYDNVSGQITLDFANPYKE